MLTEKIKIKKINDKAIIPSYGTPFAAGCDLYACCDENITINPGETKLIKTGVAIETPEGYAAMIFARSGLATKQGLAPANKVGVVDSDYRGEVMVALHNHSNEQRIVEPEMRIAQLIFMPYLKADFVLAEDLDDTERGESGFGSTGTK